MAGSLGYSVKVAHVYQRRFDSDSLAQALQNSHLYIISRRPAIRVDKSRVRLYEEKMEVGIKSRRALNDSEQSELFIMPLEHGLQVEDFRTYSNNSYFSFRANHALVHGDSWALASIASNARPDLAGQEVLYIGQAYGTAGSGNAYLRTRRHETLQKIYEHHSGEDWDIFISPLEIVKLERSTEDHIDDDDEATLYVLGAQDDDPLFDTHKGVILPTSINLVEHALISYFSPFYNDLLKEWRPDQPTRAMIRANEIGFRTLQVYLDGWEGLARYYSPQVPERRSHFWMLAIETGPGPGPGQILYDPDVHNWRLQFARQRYVDLQNASENSNAILKIFGDQAPRIRRPPEINLSRSSATWSLEKAERDYDIICQEETSYTQPGYDRTTGLIPVGTYADGAKVHWRLTFPGEGACHGLIVGPQGTGKTNALRILCTEAICSNDFCLLVADPAGKHSFKEFADYCTYTALTLEATIRLLKNTANAVMARREAQLYEINEKIPGLLLTIENAHEAFSKSSLAARSADIIGRLGGAVGVGLVATVPDLNVARFGNRYSLRSALKKYNCAVFGAADAYEMLHEGDRDD